MLKERLYLGFAAVAAGCAGYGAMALAWRLFGFEGSLTPLLGLAIGFASLALMVRAVMAVRAERLRHSFHD